MKKYISPIRINASIATGSPEIPPSRTKKYAVATPAMSAEARKTQARNLIDGLTI